MSIIRSYFKAKNDKRSKMKSGCAYTRAIKQSLNNLFQTKSSVHFNIAKLIADFSHKSVVVRGSYMLNSGYEFFIVNEMLSPHWCKGFFCPPRQEFAEQLIMYHPDIRRRTQLFRKRIFDPFNNASIRNRARRFFLDRETRYHESMSHFPPVFA